MCVPGCQETVRQALSRRTLLRRSALTVAAGFAATAVSSAAAEVAPRQFKAIVDLTHTMSADFPTFDGKPGVEMQKVTDFKKDGYNLNRWLLNEHAGTHLDAPIHFSADGISAERIPAESLVVPLAVVDVSAKAAKDSDYQLGRDDLGAWEQRYGRLPDDCCVAMDSGWARHAADGAKYTGRDAAGTMHFPGFAPEAVDWMMAERRVAGLAVDTLSLDHGPSKTFRTHLLWLPSGRWGLENVANLGKVPAAGATLVVGLAKMQGATGGPARLMALL